MVRRPRLTPVSEGNPFRRLDVRSKARKGVDMFFMFRHDNLLYWEMVIRGGVVGRQGRRLNLPLPNHSRACGNPDCY